jgi:hypothetical protein
MSPDIIASVVAYLQSALAGTLQVGGTTSGGSINAGVFADYARDTIDGVPYIVVHDGPETYVFASDAGGCTVISDGLLQIAVIAPTKELARSIAIQVNRLVVDTVVDLFCADGTVIHLRPVRTDSVLMSDTGIAIPTAFKRVVTIEYRQQWSTPQP